MKLKLGMQSFSLLHISIGVLSLTTARYFDLLQPMAEHTLAACFYYIQLCYIFLMLFCFGKTYTESCFFLSYRKHTLNCHRMKPALFSVLCEIKEKTGKCFCLHSLSVLKIVSAHVQNLIYNCNEQKLQKSAPRWYVSIFLMVCLHPRNWYSQHTSLSFTVNYCFVWAVRHNYWLF